MRSLVPLAQLLGRLAGGYRTAAVWARELSPGGTLTPLRKHGIADDQAASLRLLARQAGLLEEGEGDSFPPLGGSPLAPTRLSAARLAELQVLLDALSDLDPDPMPAVPDRPLVFTAPARAAHLVGPGSRLDLLVQDVIARAAHELHIGGPFWNQEGCDLLREVLQPALSVRRVAARFYAHDGGRFNGPLKELVRDCDRWGDTALYWWTGGDDSMMHAKFAVADSHTGYFGSANLTSPGLLDHFEIGVELGPAQAASLVELCVRLRTEGLFAAADDGPGIPQGPLVRLDFEDGRQLYGQLLCWIEGIGGRREAEVAHEVPRAEGGGHRRRVLADERCVVRLPGQVYDNVPVRSRRQR